jgi:hypothetical protein
MTDRSKERIDDDGADDLDRALFALPLAEPPAGLRAAILRATIYGQPVVSTALGRTETIVIGVVLALAAWFLIACIANRALAAGLDALVLDTVRGLTDARTILWLGFGVATAIAFTKARVPAFGALARSPFAGDRSA